MKPRNKHERRLIELSGTLPNLTKEQRRWGLKHALEHIGYRSKKHIACLDCGHIWNGPRIVLSCICPVCGNRLKLEDTRKKKLSQRRYFSILDVREEFQIVRHFEIYSHHTAGATPRQYVSEVIQQFITTDGKINVVARNWTVTYYIDSFSGDLEIRNVGSPWQELKYDLWPHKIYPKIKCLPIYQRNGYKKVDGVSPYQIFSEILTDSISETLLKAKQFGLLALRVGNKRHELTKHWDSVKICLRNKYFIKVDDATTWLDYIELLVYFKKDLRNLKYVCPVDLKKAHNQLVAKKREIDDHRRYTSLLVNLGKSESDIKNMSASGLKALYDTIRYTGLLIGLGIAEETLKNRAATSLQIQYDKIIAGKKQQEREEEKARELERQKKQFLEDQKAYDRDKKIFFGLVFKKGSLAIKVLESIQEFIDESEAHGHCVYTSNYYRRKDSLILSAKVDGQPVETIEISLSNMKIVQSRGLENEPTKYHDQIVKLMQRNLPAIRKRYRELQKVAA